MFIHQPYGAFDFTGADGKFTPPAARALPLDLFVVGVARSARRSCASTRASPGLPEMPALWTFGYMQSIRTLAGPTRSSASRRTFREKKLPCDTLIYLGTEFAPSGWNTRNGEFTWHPTNFPDPKKHARRSCTPSTSRSSCTSSSKAGGSPARCNDPCTAPPLPTRPDARQSLAAGPPGLVLLADSQDAAWTSASTAGGRIRATASMARRGCNRHRMYWEGTQLFRPNERPFALHRNASAGIQRFGGFIWSGDVQIAWETLKTHVAGRDQHGTVRIAVLGHRHRRLHSDRRSTRASCTSRWFQFGAFCPLVPRARPQLASASCRGDGTAATAARSRRDNWRADPERAAQSAQSSRSAGSISSCATG